MIFLKVFLISVHYFFQFSQYDDFLILRGDSSVNTLVVRLTTMEKRIFTTEQLCCIAGRNGFGKYMLLWRFM